MLPNRAGAAKRCNATVESTWGTSMLGRINTAVLIDYENITQAHSTLPKSIPNWTAWIERGEFDEKRRRRKLVQKRIYWNSSTDHLRPQFERFGFVAVLCEKYAQLKNGADIRMTIDIIESTFKNPRIKEFILVTRDSDFVPVLQSLRQRQKRTAVLVDRNKPAIYTTYRQHADIVIPIDQFLAATAYTKPEHGRAIKRAIAYVSGLVWTYWHKARERRAAKQAAAKAEAVAKLAATQENELLDIAVDHVIRVTSLTPNLATARKKIENELRELRGFSTTGRNKYLGKGNYQALMREIAKKTNRIKVSAAYSGGISVTYVPRDEEE
jgi:uncharacterized LabA/DUF88 family protein